ncbi:hypothetical protein Rhal01_02829 [Rubritalea halochordaticola]|uniref:DUF1592 domain-containing protein n=1 Tax=Rubritalea halochordaticola TaxID=714537 RepID=A0ABP9V3Y7_9BACT
MLQVSPTLWLKSSLVISCFVTGWLLAPWFGHQKTLTSAEPLPDSPLTTTGLSDTELTTQWEKNIKPLLQYYCYDCHGDGSHKGGLCLDDFDDLASIRSAPKTWEHILSRIDYQLMPPVDEEQPAAHEITQMVDWINDTVFPTYESPDDPGPGTTRRLNRLEYQNTLRDLLGVDVDILEMLPPDDSAHGFDNVNAALTLSPAHIERYLKASDLALDKAIVIGPMPTPLTRLNLSKAQTEGRVRDEGIFLHTRGSAIILQEVEHEGEYVLHVTASASRSGNEYAKLEVGHSDASITTFSIENPMHRPKQYTTKLKLKQGTNRISLTFINDHWDPEHPNPKLRDRNLMIHKATLVGPSGLKRDKPASHHAIFPPRRSNTSDEEYARDTLQQFSKRAFRRPTNGEEIQRYVQLAQQIASQQDSSINQGIRGAIQAMLVSPSFLFLNLPTQESKNDTEFHLVSEHQLASRLSYFLWSSMPDETLLDLADKNQLRQQLDSQIERMLRDPRAHALTKNFAGQWLQLRDLDAISPDRKTYPDFNPKLRRDMQRETTLLVDEIILQDKSLLSLLDANYSYLNGRLARHYGIPDVAGENFRKVSLSGTPRRGILTHASILTLTSQPTRTSPVLRGKFVLENILHITPPPPPPNLPPLEDAGAHSDKLSLRQQLELHREKTSCASCHNLMDPIGFALENFDGIGAWQDSLDGQAIDTSGQLVTGEKLTGADSLLKVLSQNKKEEFLHSLTAKMLTYALGRGTTRADRNHIATILKQLHQNDYRAHSLIRAIVHSPTFQYQRN